MTRRLGSTSLALALAAALEGCRGAAAHDARPQAPAITSPAPGEIQLAEVPAFVKIAEAASVADAGATAATGKVAFDEEHVSRVAAPVSGRVVDLLVRPGDRVERGQPLLAIATPDAQSALADWVAAVADKGVADRNLERQKRLYADQATSFREVMQAESEATKAAAGLTRAKGRLTVLGVDPASADARSSRFLLRAPIAGLVVERPATPGMEVRADTGTPLVTVADLSRVWVLADVYERDLGVVARGQHATVRVTAYPTRAFDGLVTYVGDVVDPQTRTVKVRIEVANQDLALKPEMFARVAMAGGAGDGRSVSVPSDAVVSDGDATAVVVALDGNRFQKRTVEVGSEADGRVRILSGVRPGERVVVDGALFLASAIAGS